MGIVGFARGAAKALAAGGLHYSGVRDILARASRIAVGGRRVLILSYHRVVEDFDREARWSIPGLLVSRRTFEKHLDALDRTGFDVVPFSVALEVISGRLEPRRDVAVLTFDDGYRDVYEHAFPVLSRRGLPATVYLASGLVGTRARFVHDRLFHLIRLALRAPRGGRGRNVLEGEALDGQASQVVDRLMASRSARELAELLARLRASLDGEGELEPSAGEVVSWEMVQRMAQAGIEFGAHTVHHVVLPFEADEALDREVFASKVEIEERLGRPVRDFAYPNGCYNPRVVASLVHHGFRSAVTTEDLPNHAGGDLFRLRRKTIWENYSRGPFGYSSPLIACHLDDVFTLLALTRPVSGSRPEALPPGTARGAARGRPILLEREAPAKGPGARA